MNRIMCWLPAVVAVLGCAPAGRGDTDELGSLELALEADGVTLDSVTIAIRGDGYSRTTVVRLTKSTRISALISGLPTGNLYATLSATDANDPAVKCSGEGAFLIHPRGTTQASIDLFCKGEGSTGSVAIDGSVYRCPLIEGISAEPSEAALGEVMTVSATTDDAESNLIYEWRSTSRATLSGADTPEVEVTCATPGPVRLRLLVTRADGACADQMTEFVYCTSTDPPAEVDDPTTPGDDRPGYLECGAETCAPGSVCCQGDIGCAASPGACIDAGAPDTTGYKSCDGPEDCPPTEECAGSRHWVSCGPATFYGIRCHRDSDCASTTESPNPCLPSGYCDGPWD